VRLALIGAVTLLPLATLTACGGSEDDAADGPITVKASDTSCQVARGSSKAGNVTFEVTNTGSKVTEFYLYAPGDRIMGEVENITPGLTRRLIVEVPEVGKYQTACKPGMNGDGIRDVFDVTGSAGSKLSDNAKLAAATKSYQRYVSSQSDALLARTTEFVNLVKAAPEDMAKIEQAKAVYPIARTYWERIEPVAESFGGLDPKIDGREDVIGEGMKFTGYHRIEKDLWQDGLQPDTSQMADQLLVNVKEIVAKSKSVQLNPLQLANGAKELLDEVASGKITGEEDRYSHTDLYDFRANVDGSQAAIAALRPVIAERSPQLASTLDSKFNAVDKLLDTQRKGDGFKLYTELTKPEIKQLAEAVDALGEPVSKVAEVVAGN
jgi:iron uptake system component EfeO